MVKVGAAYLFRLMVKLAKNAAIRGANEAAGRPMPSIVLDGVIGMTDDAVDGVYKWYIAARTADQRRDDAEELANNTPGEIEEGIAKAASEEAPAATEEVKARALAIASAARRTLHERLTVVGAHGRSVLQPGVRLDSAADLARLFASGGNRQLNPGDHVGGRYRIERFLAQGGMGEVYLATQTRMQRSVVLKTILPAIAAKRDFRERFFEEARLAAKLSHPHIVPVYDADEDEARGLCFLTMQHLGGEPLDRWLRRRPAGVSLAEFAKLSAALCAALAHAHEPPRGVLHFDLKPGNVMVSEDLSDIFVVDFGLAKACGEGTGGPGAAAMVTSIGGTPYYMAPEVLRGQKADARADVYSLGVIFYELLTGEQPVAGCDPVCEVRPDVPKTISDAIRQAMRPRLADRTPDVEALRAALNKAPVESPPKMVDALPKAQAVVVPDHWADGLGLNAATTQGWDRFCFEDGPDDWVRHSGERLRRDAAGFARARELVGLWKAGGAGMNVAKLLIAAKRTKAGGSTHQTGGSRRVLPETAELRAERALIEDEIRYLLQLNDNAPVGPVERARVTDIEFVNKQITDAGVAWLAHPATGLKALSKLKLLYTSVTDAGVTDLARADTGLRALIELNLMGTQVTDAGVKDLARANTGLKALTALNLYHTHITDAGAAALAEKDSGLKALTTLNLGHNKITDVGAAALAEKDSGLKALTALELQFTQITDAGAALLAAKDSGLKHLTTLNLWGTKITDAGVAAIKARYPGIKISR
jgi:hypothetical protein